MPGTAVSVVVAAAEEPCWRAAAALFPQVACCVLSTRELRPPRPLRGPLFELFAAQPRGGCVGLVVPLTWRADRASGDCPGAAGAAELVPIADHVNLEVRGPLCGRWPPGVARSFPALAGIYQPALVRALGGARVYSAGVVVAGVSDAGRLTPFELGAIQRQRLPAVSNVLAPPAIAAAFYGLRLAACGVPRADEHNEK
jgi:hypothetical protein